MVVVMGLFGAASAEDLESPFLTDEEHKKIIDLLDESHDLLIGLTSGLTDEQWNFKQNDKRWSVGECAEHIIRSEEVLLQAAVIALAKEPNKEWREATKGKTELLENVMPNRRPMGQGGATAPFEIRPSENWSRAKFFEEYYKIRGQVRAMVETIDRPIKEYTEEHPFPIFNTLSAHDWIIYVPLHTIRHSRQMIEVMEDENYPNGDKK
jgi:hypothetical protein